MNASPTTRNCLPCPNFILPGPSTFIFFPKSSLYFLTVIANAVFRVGPRNKIGHPAHSHKRFKQVSAVSAYRSYRYKGMEQKLGFDIPKNALLQYIVRQTDVFNVVIRNRTNL